MAHADHGSQSSDEPKTPMWLPALGALLFLLAGIWWATRPSAPDEVKADAPAAASAAPAAVSAQPRQAAPAPDPHAGHGH